MLPIVAFLTILVRETFGYPASGPPAQPTHSVVAVGWNDEMNVPRLWRTLDVENKPVVTIPIPGSVRLTMRQVPAGWPYEYQWSGVTREATIDVGKSPFLAAHVTELLGGYAHMDVDVLDAQGRVIKSIRSSTIQSGGVTWVDLSQHLTPATYRLRMRLIVGGSNQGCYATYSWVRFTNNAGGQVLLKSPATPNVVLMR
ncbi:MAG: hypothetical protein KF812_11220 [Fimbriimonadaceae bacterium]|nr:hypothetical protein [Fimbriimonadaceae bacterium]